MFNVNRVVICLLFYFGIPSKSYAQWESIWATGVYYPGCDGCTSSFYKNYYYLGNIEPIYYYLTKIENEIQNLEKTNSSEINNKAFDVLSKFLSGDQEVSGEHMDERTAHTITKNGVHEISGKISLLNSDNSVKYLTRPFIDISQNPEEATKLIESECRMSEKYVADALESLAFGHKVPELSGINVSPTLVMMKNSILNRMSKEEAQDLLMKGALKDDVFSEQFLNVFNNLQSNDWYNAVRRLEGDMGNYLANSLKDPKKSKFEYFSVNIEILAKIMKEKKRNKKDFDEYFGKIFGDKTQREQIIENIASYLVNVLNSKQGFFSRKNVLKGERKLQALGALKDLVSTEDGLEYSIKNKKLLNKIYLALKEGQHSSKSKDSDEFRDEKRKIKALMKGPDRLIKPEVEGSIEEVENAIDKVEEANKKNATVVPSVQCPSGL